MNTHALEIDMSDITRLALLEQSVGHINEAILRIERGFLTIDKNFDKLENRFDRVEKKMENTRHQSWSQFRWIVGAVITLFGTIISVVMKEHIG